MIEEGIPQIEVKSGEKTGIIIIVDGVGTT